MEVLPFFVIVMNKDEILAEKVRTVITRNRARDIYDLWFLLQGGAGIDLKLINAKLSYYKKEFDKEVFMEQLRTKEGYWEPELKSLVIGRLPGFDVVYKDVKKMLRGLL